MNLAQRHLTVTQARSEGVLWQKPEGSEEQGPGLFSPSHPLLALAWPRGGPSGQLGEGGLAQACLAAGCIGVMGRGWGNGRLPSDLVLCEVCGVAAQNLHWRPWGLSESVFCLPPKVAVLAAHPRSSPVMSRLWV